MAPAKKCFSFIFQLTVLAYFFAYETEILVWAHHNFPLILVRARHFFIVAERAALGQISSVLRIHINFVCWTSCRPPRRSLWGKQTTGKSHLQRVFFSVLRKLNRVALEHKNCNMIEWNINFYFKNYIFFRSFRPSPWRIVSTTFSAVVGEDWKLHKEKFAMSSSTSSIAVRWRLTLLCSFFFFFLILNPIRRLGWMSERDPCWKIN